MAQAIVAGLALVGLFLVGIAPVPPDDEKPGDIEARGVVSNEWISMPSYKEWEG